MVTVIERPEVFLIQRPQADWSEIRRYLNKVSERTGTNATAWADRVEADPDICDAEAVVEFGGRLCYRSWVEGANANVTRVREDTPAYFKNILSSGHGSVLQHANYTFAFDDVSRVLTHELVRHGAGTAFSQESMRYVRLTDLSLWFPEWARSDEALMYQCLTLLTNMERHQQWMSEHFGLDRSDIPFEEKKHKTSFMRRFAPDGVATGIVATINVRALRHIIALRTALPAEEEIRLVMDDVAHLALKATPNMMQDYSPNENLEWKPEFLKV